MNIECDKKTLDELTGAFRFSDAVIRNLVVAVPSAVVEPSPMAKEEEGVRGDESSAQDRDGGDEAIASRGEARRDRTETDTFNG
jgi:hypothetical protein